MNGRMAVRQKCVCGAECVAEVALGDMRHDVAQEALVAIRERLLDFVAAHGHCRRAWADAIERQRQALQEAAE